MDHGRTEPADLDHSSSAPTAAPPSLSPPKAAHTLGAAPAGAADPAELRALLARLTLEQKIALLTGIGNFALPGQPRIGCAAGGLRRPGRRARTARPAGPLLQPAGPDRAGRRLGSGAGRPVAGQLGREARAKGIDMLLGPDPEPGPHPLRRPHFESFGEDPLLAAGSRGLRARHAVGRRGRHCQALRGQRLGDRPLDGRRAHRRGRAARGLPRPVRGPVAEGGARWSWPATTCQRRDHDRARRTARTGAQARVGLPRRGGLRLERRPLHRGHRRGRPRPGHARPGGHLERRADRRGGPRRRRRGRDRRQGDAAAAGRRPGRRPGRAARRGHGRPGARTVRCCARPPRRAPCCCATPAACCRWARPGRPAGRSRPSR